MASLSDYISKPDEFSLQREAPWNNMNQALLQFCWKERGEKFKPKKSPSSRHVFTQQQKGKPEISEQVLTEAISSQSDGQYRGDRLPSPRVARLNACARWCKTPLLLWNRSGSGIALRDHSWTSAFTSERGRGCESCSDLDFKKPVFCSRFGNWFATRKKPPENKTKQNERLSLTASFIV